MPRRRRPPQPEPASVVTTQHEAQVELARTIVESSKVVAFGRPIEEQIRLVAVSFALVVDQPREPLEKLAVGRLCPRQAHRELMAQATGFLLGKGAQA